VTLCLASRFAKRLRRTAWDARCGRAGGRRARMGANTRPAAHSGRPP